jgi:hypothetical protein
MQNKPQSINRIYRMNRIVQEIRIRISYLSHHPVYPAAGPVKLFKKRNETDAS